MATLPLLAVAAPSTDALRQQLFLVAMAVREGSLTPACWMQTHRAAAQPLATHPHRAFLLLPDSGSARPDCAPQCGGARLPRVPGQLDLRHRDADRADDQESGEPDPACELIPRQTGAMDVTDAACADAVQPALQRQPGLPGLAPAAPDPIDGRPIGGPLHSPAALARLGAPRPPMPRLVGTIDLLRALSLDEDDGAPEAQSGHAAAAAGLPRTHGSLDLRQFPDRWRRQGWAAVEPRRAVHVHCSAAVDAHQHEWLRAPEAGPNRRPVALIFPGLGCDWPGMGAELLRLAPFCKAVEASSAALVGLEPAVPELTALLASGAPLAEHATILFCAIVAVELALVDVLRGCGLAPATYVLGHSLGEVACGYACGLLTRAEAMRIAHAEGVAAAAVPGLLAAVGMGEGEARTLLPKGVEVVCHNGPCSVTVAGDADVLAAAVAELRARGIDARMVQTAGTACHWSERFARVQPQLEAALTAVLTAEPGATAVRPRPTTWLSSSQPEDGQSPSVPLSAAYLAHNLAHPVLFNEALSRLPADTLVVEVGPSAILSSQVVLAQRSGPTPPLKLMSRNGPAMALLAASLGRLYSLGVINAPPEEWLAQPGFPTPSPEGSDSGCMSDSLDHADSDD